MSYRGSGRCYQLPEFVFTEVTDADSETWLLDGDSFVKCQLVCGTVTSERELQRSEPCLLGKTYQQDF